MDDHSDQIGRNLAISAKKIIWRKIDRLFSVSQNFEPTLGNLEVMLLGIFWWQYNRPNGALTERKMMIDQKNF